MKSGGKQPQYSTLRAVTGAALLVDFWRFRAAQRILNGCGQLVGRRPYHRVRWWIGEIVGVDTHDFWQKSIAISCRQSVRLSLDPVFLKCKNDQNSLLLGHTKFDGIFAHGSCYLRNELPP